MTIHPEYKNTLAALYARNARRFKLGLEGITALLKALGNPQEKMRHIVVAGTNGKGFTSSLTAKMLQQAGYKVGLFTSPHLLRYTERIRINGEEISTQDVVRLYQQLCAVEHSASFFECTTALALLAFAEQKVDYAVMEVGLGGRLDATNIVPKTLSVITAIGFDHQQYLGNTLSAIAREKAGIIAEHGQVVIASQCLEVKNTLQTIADERQAKVTWVEKIENSLDFQQENIANVRSIQKVLNLPEQAFTRALENFTWPGRYQLIDRVLYDGAHNTLGMQALVRNLKQRSEKINVVFSALQDKPAEELLALLAPLATRIHVCPTSSSRTRTEHELQMLASPYDHASVYSTPEQAFTAALQQEGFVLVTGSLFLVADIMAIHLNIPRDPAIDG